jgi:pectinesterase
MISYRWRSVLVFVWIFSSMTLVASAEKTIVVASDGSGDHRTIQEAFLAVPQEHPERTVIRIKAGIYDGQKILPRGKNRVSLIGEGDDKTVLTYGFHANEEQPAGAGPHYKGAGMVVCGDDFTATGITFRNTAGDRGQAMALWIDGDRAVLKQCRLLGWQDTLRLNRGRQYIADSYIEGRVDFIYGGGTAYFSNCQIHSKNGGYITAASTPENVAFGFVFVRCRLTGDALPWKPDRPDADVAQRQDAPSKAAFLGRPWRPYASVSYIGCEMGDHIIAAGWDNWGKSDNEKTARFAEYGNTGPGAAAATRVAWSKQLTKVEADRISRDAVLGGTDHWKPE